MSTPRGEKLPALTSLRFFAAATVVLFHTHDAFGIAGGRWEVGGLQAVSFFFLLSGFILYHVYPALDDWKSRGRFLLARFARVYPAHLASLALLFVLLPWYGQHALKQPGVLAANLTLLQSWIPQSRYCFTLNNPSWSIATEAFFYACFPLLVLHWRRTWPVKLALACTLLLALICWVNWLGWPLQTSDPEGWCVGEFFHVFPLVRLFEFTLGMALCRAWQRLNGRPRLGPVVGTALEVFALALVVAGVLCTSSLTEHLTKQWDVPAGVICWLWNGGATIPAFALLIVVMALRPGWISRLLAHPLPLLLGEISYALYLVHGPLQDWYLLHTNLFASWPRWLCCAGYWAAALTVAYLMWRWVERPCRTLLVGRSVARPAPVVDVERPRLAA